MKKSKNEKLVDVVFKSKVDEVNMNGRKYSRECIEKIIAQLKKGFSVPVTFGVVSPTEIMPIKLWAGKIEDIKIDKENKIIGSIRILNTKEGKKVWSLIKNGKAQLATSGTGNLGAHGEVENFNLCSIGIVNADTEGDPSIKLEKSNKYCKLKN